MKFGKAFSGNQLGIALFVLVTLGLASFQFYRAVIGGFHWAEILYILGFTLWILVLGIIDIKTRYIPLWLTAPVVVLSLLVHWLIPSVDPKLNLIGFQLTLFDAAIGMAFGFIIVDLITHFGNWLAKFPASSQGLMPICLFVPVSLFAFFLLPSQTPLWVVAVLVFLVKYFYTFFYAKNAGFAQGLEKLLKNHLVIYILFLGLLLFQGAAAFYGKVSDPFVKNNFVVVALCTSFMLEEIILPFVSFLAKRFWSKKSGNFASQQVAQPVEEAQSVLGGGDATLTASLGALWGAVIINNCLLLSFIVSFVFLGLYKLYGWLSNKYANKKSAQDVTVPFVSALEVPFAPFIVLGAQVVLLLEILVKAPIGSGCALH